MQGVLDLVCVHRVLVDPWNPLCTKMIQTVCLRSAHARIEESNRRSHLWVWKLFVFRMYAVYSIYQFWNPFLSRSTVGWGQTNIKSRPAWKITLEILKTKTSIYIFSRSAIAVFHRHHTFFEGRCVPFIFMNMSPHPTKLMEGFYYR